MKVNRIYENKTLTKSDIEKYIEIKRVLYDNARNYFDHFKHELDEDYNINDLIMKNVFLYGDRIFIHFDDGFNNIDDTMNLSIDDFLRYCEDPQAYINAKKYNL
jgi:hypothetical protein